MTAPVLITGGAGFIGTNVAARLLGLGHRVVIFDNLSRGGVERNVDWLRGRFGDAVHFASGDVRSAESVRPWVVEASAVFHFAAQVAVTTSLLDPITDFEINARGTLNLLEELRHSNPGAPFFYTSTNKVYGDLADIGLRKTETRHVPTNAAVLSCGVGEDRPLCFHSPYGCSKGTADQYVLDYSRSFGIRAVVFRMSCIYGPHQFGTEDQGWVAHFLIRAMAGEPITLYGDGRQVRDILFVSDLVDAFLAAWRNLDRTSGHAFNIGGGPRNTISLVELLRMIREITGRTPAVDFEGWRVGDQRYYVSDTRRFTETTGWRQSVGVRDGVEALARWLADAHNGVRLAPAAHERLSPAMHGGAA